MQFRFQRIFNKIKKKTDSAAHYKKYTVWSGIDKDNKFISYVRYADDFLIGIVGSRKYAL